MKRLWRHKWLAMAAAVAIFLSVGAVAWAAVDKDPATAPTATALGTGEGSSLLLASSGEEGSSLEAAGAGMKKAARERIEQLRKMRAALMEKLREDMTPADQALYDQLTATAKTQREALQKAREALAGTIKQLRDLGRKYLDPGNGTANPTG